MEKQYIWILKGPPNRQMVNTSILKDDLGWIRLRKSGGLTFFIKIGAGKFIRQILSDERNCIRATAAPGYGVHRYLL
jgi:hypothetical protein